MTRELADVAASYDAIIRDLEKGKNPYAKLPKQFVTHPDFSLLYSVGEYNSEKPSIKEFLDPKLGDKFADLGCHINLIQYSLDTWPSTYYGVDISIETINYIKDYVKRNNKNIGGLYAAGIDNMPFEDNFFDITACVGVVEYFTLNYAKLIVKEICRVLKKGGRCYIDIPNVNHKASSLMFEIESYLGRTNHFQYAKGIFLSLLEGKFKVEKIEDDNLFVAFYITKI